MVIISWNPYPLFEVFRVFPSSFSMFRYHGMAQYLDGRVLRVLIYNTTHRLNIQIGLQVGLCCVLSDNKGTDRFVSVGSRPHQDRAVSQFLDLQLFVHRMNKSYCMVQAYRHRFRGLRLRTSSIKRFTCYCLLGYNVENRSFLSLRMIDANIEQEIDS